MFLANQYISSIHSHLKPDVTNLLLFAEKTSVDIQGIIDQANQNGFRVAGGIFPMVINEGEHHEAGCVVKYIDGDHNPHIVEGVGKGKLDFKLPPLKENDRSCLVFLDGLMINITRFLERLYEQYWNRVDYVGAGCGSLSLQQTPCVFDNTGIYQDAALIVLSTEEIQLGVKHGWQKIAGPFVANKTEGNKVYELNWQPAFEVYKEVVKAHAEVSFEDTDFFSISKGFPFGMYKEGKEDIVRDPIAVDEDGALVCVGNVSQNVSLNILCGNSQKLVESAFAAAMESMDGSTKDILIVDCISRVLYLEDSFDKELEAVKQAIQKSGGSFKSEGVLSIGEISSSKEGYLELYNKTIVISSFH
ncbi:MAG: FIST C-terminal domain-containing protein [Ekhidna sp.]|nr:FIST C-terminal domain-containing protein [Ekhidna sp.]MBC6426106.1 FIST C-terminal domain-containing protein [Ekhidna sp.]